MRWLILCLCFPLLMASLRAEAADEHRRRREALMQRLGDGLILVRGRGAEEINWNFFYLTGLHEPAGVLLLAPEGMRVETGRRFPGPDYQRGRKVHQVLFLPGTDPLAARWGEDASATSDALSPEVLGVDRVYPLDLLDEMLGAILRETPRVRVAASAAPSLLGAPDPALADVPRIRSRYPGVPVEDATPAVFAMRRRKEPAEVEAIRRSVQVTGGALAAVMAAARPGMHEYELEAELVRAYRAAGGTHAFDPIVGSGPNAVKLHYRDNTRKIEPGELVLVDTGVSIGGYKSDITRTFPVDGRFTPRQREVYEVVLAALEAALEIVRPGVTTGQVHARAFEVIDEAGYGAYFVHGTSHYLGLETHDVGDPYAPLEPGVVITVEPGIYIPEENLGIRIEDDVVVTETGYENLSRHIPKGIAEVEAACAARR